MTADGWMDTVVVRRKQEAEGVISIELVAASGGSLPPAEAGAHVDVDMGQGLVRQYSLCGDPAEMGRYRLAVLLEPASRGGSAGMHLSATEGAHLMLRPPRNAFRLDEGAPYSVLLAGGIGVTPLMAMAWRLHAIGRPFGLHYCVRTRARAAFADELLTAPFVSAVRLHVDGDGADAGPSAALVRAPAGAHAYICGPAGFIAAMEQAAADAGFDPDRRHVERFSATGLIGDSFMVVAARSGVTVEVGPDRTIADTLIDAGISVPLSCEAGICGTCLTRVLDGEPDHRDQFLTEEERLAGNQITLCCSRSLGPRLVLDI